MWMYSPQATIIIYAQNSDSRKWAAEALLLCANYAQSMRIHMQRRRRDDPPPDGDRPATGRDLAQRPQTTDKRQGTRGRRHPPNQPNNNNRSRQARRRQKPTPQKKQKSVAVGAAASSAARRGRGLTFYRGDHDSYRGARHESWRVERRKVAAHSKRFLMIYIHICYDFNTFQRDLHTYLQ